MRCGCYYLELEMESTTRQEALMKPTSYKVVLPFYGYAAIAFLTATILLFFSSESFTQHYFHPKILAITHTIALGWGTMIILGASHLLVPVLIQGKLYSNNLAYTSFLFAASGIPLLAYSFYIFNMGWPAQLGAILINAAVICFVINVALSLIQSKKENIHAAFIFTAALWLLLTTLLGLLLVCNLVDPILPNDSIYYLPLHSNLGIMGWFLMLVIGVGSRLIPMFLISKYSNTTLLWIIYTLINVSLFAFFLCFLYFPSSSFYFIPVTGIFLALLLFLYYNFQCFKSRIRKKVDAQLKFSLLSVLLMIIPIVILALLILWHSLSNTTNTMFVMLYGFVVFFGWITVMIFGMTFKTLPFIIWDRVYHVQSGLGITPNPKALFNSSIFSLMAIVYLVGFVGFGIGIHFGANAILKGASLFLILSALLYNWNVFKIIFHKPIKP